MNIPGTGPEAIRARGVDRIVTMTNGQTMNIALPWLTYMWLTIKHYLSMWLMSAKKKAKLQAKGRLPAPPVRDVQFGVPQIRRLRYAAPWLIFRGRLVVDVPECNDPWRKPGRRKKPAHRIKFHRGWGGRRYREFAVLVLGLDLVRPDLKPTADRGRLWRAMGFRGGAGPVEVRVPEQRSRRRRILGGRTVSTRGPAAAGPLPPTGHRPPARPRVENAPASGGVPYDPT